MNGKSTSYFIAGLLVGGLVATAGFAWVVRNQGSGSATAERIVLKLGHSLDQSHPVHIAMVDMASRLEQKSAGSVRLEIFPNGQLGSETECLEQVQRGAMAMTKTSTAPMEGFVPEMAVFSVPYIFRDDDHYWRVIDGEIGRQLLISGLSIGLRGLCFYDAGSRSFYTISRPINTPADLKGLKIRVQSSKTSMDMVDALGGSPTPIAWGELFTALQQSLVDGAENNTPSFVSNRHYEVCKFLSLDEHTRVPDILFISETVWSRLPAHVQQWVQESAAESSKFQRELWAKESQTALETAQREGVKIQRPDKAAFADRVGNLQKSFAGSVVGNLLKKIEEL